MKRKYSLKKRVFEIINKAEGGDLASKIFDWTIMALIALSIISIILESFADIYARYNTLFRIFEIITVVVFTAEYLLRIWTADLLFPEANHPRLKYVFSFMALIDLLAILPFYLPFFFPAYDASFQTVPSIAGVQAWKILRCSACDREGYTNIWATVDHVCGYMLFCDAVLSYCNVYCRESGAT